MTPEQILHKWDTHVSEPCASMPLIDSDKIALGRAIIAQARAELIAEMVPVAWASPDDAGEPLMFFPDRGEAATYCAANEEPLPLAIIPKE